MAADGISIQAGIAQAGQAAQSQSKGQQKARGTSLTQRLADSKELKTERVQPKDEADRRQREAESEEREAAAAEEATEGSEENGESQDGATEDGRGLMVDTRA